MGKRKLRRTEWSILICVILLIIIGLIALYSTSHSNDLDAFKRQLIWIGISIPLFIILIYIDYTTIARFAPYIYGATIILLIAVLFTSPINGARSWFDIGAFRLQPGEFGKIATVLFLSYIIVMIQKRSKSEINKINKLVIICGIVLLPIILIAIQPDYGTAIAYVVSLILMLFVAGIDKKYIITAILLVVILVPLLYFFVLPDHAKSRIDVYLNPNLDPRGAGYNIIQSKLAIGAGRLFGMGILQGTQTHLGFLYPKTTDFIFAVIGEEMGFITCSIIVILYTVLIVKCVNIAKNARDDLGSYISIGLVGILLFHVIENIGMTIGLLPITGVPLPFISYGGSSFLTSVICIGLLINISSRSHKNIFTDD